MNVSRKCWGRADQSVISRGVSGILAGICLIGMVGTVSAGTSVNRDIEKPVQAAIDTRQISQAAQEKWDEERRRLVAVYDRLKTENEQLTAVQDRLLARIAKQTAANAALEAERAEALKIQSEMLPHLKKVQDRMVELVETDSPFLGAERTNRLTKLAAILDDSEIPVGEKYRKTMEALSIEAEYGNTVEVYQEKISLSGTEVLGNIFRLGRVSLFFLSLDRKSGAVFNVAQDQWTAMGAESIQAVAGVTAMAARHRPMEIVSLPIGRLARGDRHE